MRSAMLGSGSLFSEYSGQATVALVACNDDVKLLKVRIESLAI